MRVIAGSAKGMPLKTLEGLDTRPTIDRVKEGMFSSIQFLLPGAKVLDLFAGSGQLGIEALSRGAEKAVFTDQNPAAAKIVIQNLKSTGLFKKSRVVNMEAQQFIAGSTDIFNIVFMDPPYNNGIVQKMLEILPPLLSNGAIVLCETELGCDLPQTAGTLEKKKSYKYGKVLVTKYINIASTKE